jgi:D-hydroxyproline dehydrogenase subunit beta
MHDLIIIGSGVLGTFHAYHAAKAGQRVLLLEKDAQPAGATVRNFGQVVPSGMAGRWFDYGRRSLDIYKTIQQEADITARANGSIYVASDETELGLIHELYDHHAAQTGYACELLTPAQTLKKYPTLRPDYVQGALFFPDEISVEPELMIGRLIQYIQEKFGVEYQTGAAVVDVQQGAVQPGSGGATVRVAGGNQFQGRRVLICSGHEARLLFPQIMAQSGIIVSKLQMLLTAPIAGLNLPGNILTGLTIRRYESFQALPSFAGITTPDHLAELKKWGIHILFKQATDGSVIVGDSHEYAPIRSQETLGYHTTDYLNNLMLTEARRIVNFPLNKIQKTWAGFYGQTDHEIFEYDVDENIRIITGIGGKGMTSSAGYAEETIRGFISS